MAVVLVCPLCGTTVADGDEAPAPGRCPGCGARYAGDAETPPGAAGALLAALEVDGIDPDWLARALFALPPADPRSRRAGITSDRRDTFYRWWAFVRDDGDGAEAALASALG